MLPGRLVLIPLVILLRSSLVPRLLSIPTLILSRPSPLCLASLVLPVSTMMIILIFMSLSTSMLRLRQAVVSSALLVTLISSMIWISPRPQLLLRRPAVKWLSRPSRLNSRKPRCHTLISSV